MSTVDRGGAPTAGEEQMDHTEMEEDSSSNVPIVTTDGTFITDMTDVTVTESRYSTKRHRAGENVSDDLKTY
jgi:hypothetical protein